MITQDICLNRYYVAKTKTKTMNIISTLQFNNYYTRHNAKDSTLLENKTCEILVVLYFLTIT